MIIIRIIERKVKFMNNDDLFRIMKWFIASSVLIGFSIGLVLGILIERVYG